MTLQVSLGNERPKVMDIVNIEPGPGNRLPSVRLAFLQRALQGFLNSGQEE
ncbi:hypothetical protein DPMN_167865 [Dreissena polymorpha]|uniref:Uncharacterized protein n=3 Tax=Dreissena polymorpha TaxID=45954 RepID=A0A9D4IYR5_DREPO|nr:hypothetical protein DPMN_167865 [Dreissena polymorpha]